ncbi:sugar ABC transporter ATP-binding protein [Shouchella shacheensis]|uniref:sugar ABC transporter ATP-binding protein n=1 Tax=Shouchella shacheensis TaxID=1649580 RepID=UPI00073FD2A3|nr:sugar ABC transporter ATP-binding protein [Shouchella shacheensis]
MGKAILQMSKISKSFNSVNVLNEVDFEVEEGEVHALMGGNGAGKSTLMKILTGVYSKDSGEIRISGEIRELMNQNEAVAAGVSMIFQEFSLIPKLTVAQNIYLNREPKTKYGMIDDRKMVEDAKNLLEELELSFSPKELVENISIGYWQMTEIAKSLSMNTKILVMDEPTSTLTKTETEILFALIRRLKENGITIIYISHRMDEIFRICDRITVLRNGKKAATSIASETTMDELVTYIIGGNMKSSFEWIQRDQNENLKPLLEVKNIKSGDKVQHVSFTLYEGEILGLAGLMGSGRSETARVIFGIDELDSGEIWIKGERKSIKSPKDAINYGVGLVPEDRRSQGLVLEHNVKENLILPSLEKLSNLKVIKNKIANEKVESFVEKLNVKTDGIYKTVSLLSGGNQQKIVLAKWLLNDTEILILDEPTSGVDIGAKTEIIKIIREIANSGKAVLVISSEMKELLAMSDRLLVMKDGKVTRSIKRTDINSEEDVERAIQSE